MDALGPHPGRRCWSNFGRIHTTNGAFTSPGLSRRSTWCLTHQSEEDVHSVDSSRNSEIQWNRFSLVGPLALLANPVKSERNIPYGLFWLLGEFLAIVSICQPKYSTPSVPLISCLMSTDRLIQFTAQVHRIARFHLPHPLETKLQQICWLPADWQR